MGELIKWRFPSKIENTPVQIDSIGDVLNSPIAGIVFEESIRLAC